MDVATFCPVLYLHWNYGSCLFQPLRRVFWWRYHLCYLYSVGSCNFIGYSIFCLRPLDERSFGRRIIEAWRCSACDICLHASCSRAICSRGMLSHDMYFRSIRTLNKQLTVASYKNYCQQKSSEACIASELSYAYMQINYEASSNNLRETKFQTRTVPVARTLT